MFADRDRNKRIILCCVYIFIGIIIRLYYLYQFSASPLFNIPIGPDVEEYSKWANNILAGQMLWDTVHIHSPLYPYFFAMLCWIFSGVENLFGWMRFTQLFLGLISVIPLYLSLKMLLKENLSDDKSSIENRVTKGLFLFLWLCYPPLIFYMGELTSEVLLIPLFSLSIFFLYSSEQGADIVELKESSDEEDEEEENQPALLTNKTLSKLALAGLFAGFAVLAHPLSLFFIFFESIYLLLFAYLKRKHLNFRTNLLRFAIFVIFAIMPVIPIVIYNTVILKESVPLQANSGFNFYLGNGPEADGTCRLRPGPEWTRAHREAAMKAKAHGLSKDRYLFVSTLKFIRDNPVQWLKLLSCKALYVWNEKELTAGADLLPLRYFTSFQRNTRWAFGLVALFAILAILINIGPNLAGGDSKNSFFKRYRHFLILLFAFWVAQTLLVTSGRYRVAMLSAILILASAGVASIICVIRNNRKRAILLIPVLAIAISVVYLPSPPFHPDQEIAEAQSLLGEALIRQGRYREAEGQLRSAAKHQPDWSRNYNLLGLISEKQEKFEDAMEYYRKAIKCDFGDPEGYLNIATLYANMKKFKEANQFFIKALSMKKATPVLYYNYALYCADRGDTDLAMKYYHASIKLDPSNIQAVNNLGAIYFQQNNFEKAIYYFEIALRLEPRNPNRMLNLALAFIKSGNTEKAKDMIQKATAIDPNIPALNTLIEMMEENVRE